MYVWYMAWMTGDGEVLGASSSGSAAFRAKRSQRLGHLRPKILYFFFIINVIPRRR